MNPTELDLLRVWWTVSAMLVLLMQIGFICLEMGCVRESSRPGIALKNLVMLLASSLGFTLLGIHLFFGPDRAHLVGWGVAELPLDSNGWLFFQAGFAAVAATILSGAVAERTTLLSNVVLAFLVGTVVFSIYGHWVWHDQGWLRLAGAHDFAGSGVVHFIGGISALIACKAAGPREGFSEQGTQPVGQRDLRLATVAVVLLWVGWIGFNGGSVLPSHIEDAGGFNIVGGAVLATCCAASGGGLSTIVLAALHRWRWGEGRELRFGEALRQKLLFDPWATLSGTMGGMVAITANCDWLLAAYGDGFLWVATAFGAVGGIASYGAAILVRQRWRLDDPVEAISVHAGAGAAGILLASLKDDTSFTAQFLMLASAFTLTFFIVGPCLLLLNRLGLLRASAVDEQLGLTFEAHEASVITAKMLETRRPSRSARSSADAGGRG